MSSKFKNADAALTDVVRHGRRRQREYTNLAGQTFGYWSVLSFAGTLNGKPFWNCLCACGKMKTVMAQSLRSGKSTSCGCYHQAKRCKPKKIAAGDVFGRLTAVNLVAGAGGIWLCRCDCGNEITTRSAGLLNGHASSCGCFGAEQRRRAATTHGQSNTREYVAMKSRQRMERKRRLDVEWTLEMDNMLRRLQPVCVVCGTDSRLTVDHVLPLSLGYGLRPGNAVILCGRCNTAKLNRLLSQLPPATAVKIAEAAAAFQHAWETN